MKDMELLFTQEDSIGSVIPTVNQALAEADSPIYFKDASLDDEPNVRRYTTRNRLNDFNETWHEVNHNVFGQILGTELRPGAYDTVDDQLEKVAGMPFDRIMYFVDTDDPGVKNNRRYVACITFEYQDDGMPKITYWIEASLVM